MLSTLKRSLYSRPEKDCPAHPSSVSAKTWASTRKDAKLSLENGRNTNPTLDTLWRYTAAAGRRLVLSTEPIRGTRPTADKTKRGKATRKP